MHTVLVQATRSSWRMETHIQQRQRKDRNPCNIQTLAIRFVVNNSFHVIVSKLGVIVVLGNQRWLTLMKRTVL